MITETTYYPEDLEKGKCKSCSEKTWVVINDGRCPECIEEQKFYEETMKGPLPQWPPCGSPPGY